MARLTSGLLHRLLKRHSLPAVTLYMPVHTVHTPPAMHEDQTRYKNLLSQTRETMVGSPTVSHSDAQTIINQLEQLQDDLVFWERQRLGLAIFADTTTLTTVELPIDCDTYAAVDTSFHIAPVIGLLPELITYRVLVVSQKEPLLFEGDSYDLRLAPLPLPASGRSGSLQIKGKKQLSHVAPRRIDAQPEYFGGPFPVVNNDERLNFFRSVDRVLQANSRSRPLLLAGTEEDVADFRAVATYPHMLRTSLPNVVTAPDVLKLAGKAAAAVRRELRLSAVRSLESRYQQLLHDGSGLASHDPGVLRQAAAAGRIETLLLRMIQLTADTIRPEITNEPKLVFGPVELVPSVNAMALQTWQARGTVVLTRIEPGESPQDTPLAAAIFRY